MLTGTFWRKHGAVSKARPEPALVLGDEESVGFAVWHWPSASHNGPENLQRYGG